MSVGKQTNDVEHAYVDRTLAGNKSSAIRLKTSRETNRWIDSGVWSLSKAVSSAIERRMSST